MPCRIEDYALIGNCHTAALVGRDGSVDWLCLPRFDSGSCFAALLGGPEHGRWLLAPQGEIRGVRRAYRQDTCILETTFETDDGAVTLVDFMPVREGPQEREHPSLIRVVRGERGQVRMRLHLVIRFDYGSIVPWVRRIGSALRAVGGPNTLVLRTEVPLRGADLTTQGDFTVSAGQELPFVLTWHASHLPDLPPRDAARDLQDTEHWWQDWAGQCTYEGPWRPQVLRSLLTLKALTSATTGGIVAAPTTSLPEQLGGVRNWDYRYCWVRDATFTLYALLSCGYLDEARAWRDWLLRAVAGSPKDLQIMYGLAGERRLDEWEVKWLPGYQGAHPVRVGNAASGQFQLDVYGELFDALYQARRIGLEPEPEEWQVGQSLLGFLEKAWHEPDDGIWEVRGGRQHFTHSKVMAWVVFDRAVKAVEQFGREGPVERWRQVRDQIHRQVCEQGFNADMGSFVQAYGSKNLDASLLMIPLVGFLPPEDSRVRGTVAAIERDLLQDGYVLRYSTHATADGLPPGEGAFLPCTFWLSDNWVLQGRVEEARKLFTRLMGLCNDVGLISEEYDPRARRLVGNFPQAFTHVGLINSALNLTRKECPAAHRPQR